VTLNIQYVSVMKSFSVQSTRPSYGSTICSYPDWAMRDMAVSMGFCYPERLDSERLRETLAQVLSDFPDYAGRFRASRETLVIDHSHRGVVFEVAKSPKSFATLMEDASRQSSGSVLCPVMSARRAIQGKAPLFAARITETSDGCVLGVTWHHSVGDLASPLEVLNAWARAYGNTEYEVPEPVADRGHRLRGRRDRSASRVGAA
jgi:NRPS condensation-like uncharacterized protein